MNDYFGNLLLYHSNGVLVLVVAYLFIFLYFISFIYLFIFILFIYLFIFFFWGGGGFLHSLIHMAKEKYLKNIHVCISKYV